LQVGISVVKVHPHIRDHHPATDVGEGEGRRAKLRMMCAQQLAMRLEELTVHRAVELVAYMHGW
jgi:hypothetical protein